jgi:hypothetical protein
LILTACPYARFGLRAGKITFVAETLTAHLADNDGVAGGRLTDQITLGVLASSVPRDAVDEAVDSAGRQARCRDGKLPPHVMVYFAMALALFADEDYEEVAVRLAGTLGSWGCWDDTWSVPTSGGITQALQRLGWEPVRDLFAQVAQPVADLLTRGAFLAGWRLMAIGGFEWDAPDTRENAVAFGYAGKAPGDSDRPAFPKARVVTVSECGSHAVVDAEIGGVAGNGTGEQSLARSMEDLDPGQARRVRVIEYAVPDRDGDGIGEVIALITTITGWQQAPAAELAHAYQQKMGARDREQAAQDLPARPRARPSVQEPGHGPPGYLRLPAHPPRRLRADLPGRHRSRHQPRQGEIQAHRPHRPPGHRPGGLSSLRPLTRPARNSWSTSPAPATSTPSAGTAATPGRQARPAQPLRRQETRRQGHTPRRAAYDHAGQSMCSSTIIRC